MTDAALEAPTIITSPSFVDHLALHLAVKKACGPCEIRLSGPGGQMTNDKARLE